MTFLVNLWNYLNGKKTNIGAALLTLSVIISQLIIGVNHYDPHWIDVVVNNLDYVGGVLTVTGGVHQVVKANQAKS